MRLRLALVEVVVALVSVRVGHRHAVVPHTGADVHSSSRRGGAADINRVVIRAGVNRHAAGATGVQVSNDNLVVTSASRDQNVAGGRNIRDVHRIVSGATGDGNVPGDLVDAANGNRIVPSLTIHRKASIEVHAARAVDGNDVVACAQAGVYRSGEAEESGGGQGER